MSRAYHVVWVKEETTVRHGDRIDIDIDLLAILPEDEMTQLLAASLRAQGWSGEGGKVHKEIAGISVVIDGTKVTMRKDVEHSAIARAHSKSSAKAELKRVAAREKERMQSDLAKELVQKEPQVREEVQRALQDVYLQALEQKAHSMGEVESIQKQRSEDGTVEMVIKVQV